MQTRFPARVLCLAATLTLVSVATHASAQNLLINPDFESGDLTGWLAAGVGGGSSITVLAGDNGPSEAGTFRAFIDNQSEAANVSLKQSTEVGTATGGTVFYSFDLKVGQALEGGVFFAQIFAEQDGIGIVGSSGLLGNFAPTDWTVIEGSFEAPDGTDFLTIEFSAVTGAVSGSVSSMNVDNVSLSQEVSSTPDAPGTRTDTAGAKLMPASPNPFGPTTSLFFEMPQPGHVVLTVYDPSGRSVATLVDGSVSQGLHSVPFEAKGLVSGTYFYELRTDSGREIRKMTLVR